MSAPRPRASLSVDLDDRWTYLQARALAPDPGDPGFLPAAVERALALFARLGARATFFVVGRDARRPALRESLAAIAAAGHEIANHSADHLPWLALLPAEVQRAQVEDGEAAIEAATGARPRGFRGPGHAITPATRGLLVERGYLYDASPLPTFLMPIVRRVYLRGLALDDRQRRERAHLGGSFAAGFGPNRPRRLAVGSRAFVEIPVTTLPLLRLPIHFTYLQLLAERSEAGARLYFAIVRLALRAARSQPSLLLHATDLVGREDGSGLGFFPAMSTPVARKIERVESCLAAIARHWMLGPLVDQARALLVEAAA